MNGVKFVHKFTQRFSHTLQPTGGGGIFKVFYIAVNVRKLVYVIHMYTNMLFISKDVIIPNILHTGLQKCFLIHHGP